MWPALAEEKLHALLIGENKRPQLIDFSNLCDVFLTTYKYCAKLSQYDKREQPTHIQVFHLSTQKCVSRVMFIHLRHQFL